MAKVLMLIAPEGFKSEEYFVPKKILEQNDISVTTTCLKKDAVSHLGENAEVDLPLAEATADYDALVLIGGPGAYLYLDDPLAHALAKKLAAQFFDTGKIVGSICMTPAILAKAGLLEGRTVTGHSCVEKNIKAGGANYTGEEVTVDGKLVTGFGPNAAEAFGKALVETLKE